MKKQNEPEKKLKLKKETVVQLTAVTLNQAGKIKGGTQNDTNDSVNGFTCDTYSQLHSCITQGD